MITILRMGEDAMHDADFDVNRPNGFPEYLFLLTKTAGNFFVGEKWIRFPSGCAVLFLPKQKQRYHAIDKFYSDSWMHFTSTRPILDRHFPFGVPIPLRQAQDANAIFHVACTQFYGKESGRESILSHLVESLLLIASNESGGTDRPEIYYRLVEMRKEIYATPAARWKVDEIAKRLNISAGYLHASWKKHFDTTLISDVISSRIENACDLLSASNLSVEEVAERSGYANTEHFIRQFKERVGTTPKRFSYSKEKIPFKLGSGVPSRAKSER